MNLKLFEDGDNTGVSKKYEPRLGIDWIIDYYAILGISQGATDEEIKSAYHTIARGYHPDKLTRVAEELQSTGERKMELANTAYALLLDPEKKARYDELLHGWNDAQTISQDGTPIVDIHKARLPMNLLMTPRLIQEF